MKYKLCLRTLNIALESGGKKLCTHELVVNCHDGFDLCISVMNFVSNFGPGNHPDGKKLIIDLKKCVQSEVMHVSETSLRRTGKLYLEDSLYIFSVTPIEEASCL